MKVTRPESNFTTGTNSKLCESMRKLFPKQLGFLVPRVIGSLILVCCFAERDK